MSNPEDVPKEAKCPICDNHSIDENKPIVYGERDFGNIIGITCPSCGKYEISRNIKSSFENGHFKDTKYIVAGYLCETNDRKERLLITKEIVKHGDKVSTTIDQIVTEKASPPKDSNEQLDMILLKIDGDSKETGEEIFYALFVEYPTVYAKSKNEFKELLNLLDEKCYIKITNDNKIL